MEQRMIRKHHFISQGSRISLSQARAMCVGGVTHDHWHLSQVAPEDTAGSVGGMFTVAMARSDDSVVERGGSKVRRCLWLRRLREKSVTIVATPECLYIGGVITSVTLIGHARTGMGYQNEFQTENYGPLTKQAQAKSSSLWGVLFLTCGTH